jgi:hypothetical protein
MPRIIYVLVSEYHQEGGAKAHRAYVDPKRAQEDCDLIAETSHKSWKVFEIPLDENINAD